MSYLIFARKWRPMVFKDVVGQEHVTRTLENAIASGRIAHAYLFSGTRGIGKTTTARILAKALNCEKGPLAEPCNQCTYCTDITQGKSLDVLEIDGASNRGIDEIRELREMVRYASTTGKYKIYIIDEVHMLTNEAFNALLKTLEEPPDKVIFIFATTEPNKVPATILSRCQRFDFKPISFQKTKDTLARLAGEEKITISEESLWLLARKADGSLRDALSLLDQAIAFGGTAIEAGDLISMLGLVDQELYFEATAHILDKKLDQAVELVNKIVDQGYDWGSFLEGLIEHLRNLLVTRTFAGADQITDIPETYKAKYHEQAGRTSEGDVLKMIQIVSDTAFQIKRSIQPKFLMEVMMARLVQLESSVSVESLLSRLAELKSAVAGGVTVARPAEPAPEKPPPPVDTDPGTPVTEASAPAPAVPKRQGVPLNRDNVVEYWQQTVESVKKKKVSLGAMLDEAEIADFNESELVLGFDPSHKFHVEQVRKQRDLIEREIMALAGRKLQIKCVVQEKKKDSVPQAENGQPADPDKIYKSDPTTEQIAQVFNGKIIK